MEAFKKISVDGSYSHEIKIPSSWEFAPLHEVIELVGGSQPPKSVFKYEPEDGYVRLIQIRDYKSDGHKVYIPRHLARRFVSPDEVMIGRYGPPIFQILRGLDGAYNVALMKAVPICDVFSKDYLFKYLSNKDLYNYVDSASDRTAGQSGVNKEHLEKYPVAVPPLAEQQQITRKLDELLAQVDILKTRLDTIPKILKRFRQSVLAAAVSAKLTEEWRGNQELDDAHVFYYSKVNLPNEYKRGGKQAVKGTIDLNTAWLPVLPTKWTYRTVDELYHTNHLFEYVDGNHGSLYPLKSDFSDTGILFVTASQIGEGSEIAWGEVPRLNKNKAGILVKGWSMAGDVLLTHNATVGRTAIVPDSFNEKFLLGTSVTLYRTSDSYIVRKYLYYFFNSRMWQSQLESVMGQTTRNQVSITKQALMQVALPPTKEQTEIVRRVEQLFAYADQIEQRVKDAQARVNHLTQSILAKAFSGELTAEWRAQNPELISGENSAASLLERIGGELAEMAFRGKGKARKGE